MRLVLALLTISLAVPFAADAQKLYRWTDKDGKVHYSDHVPPEAIDQARDEINKQGIKVGEVPRALTEEEKAAAQEQARLAEERAKAEAERANRDNILLSSYGSLAELERAYAERFDLIEQSLESARIGVQSQEKSLSELLAHAAGLERQGKPVPETVKSSINLAKTQVGQQRDYLAKREAEKVALQHEYEQTKTHYLELKDRQGAAPAQP